jgi:MFS family permease
MSKTVPALFQDRANQLVILLLAGCLTTMTGSIVLPIFPEMRESLNLEGSWGAGVLVSIHTLPSALSTVALGKLADRIGKLKILIPCLLLYGVIGISTVFFTTMPLLLTSRALLGIASGGIAAATIGILGGMFAGETRLRILGYATGAMTIAAIIFPLLGGWVGATHWQYAFYPYLAALPLAIVAALNLKEPKPDRASLTGGQQQLGKILQNPEIIKLYLFIGATGIIVYSVVVYTPPFLVQTIGADPFLIGFILAIRLVGAAIVSAFGASRLAKRFGQKAAVAFGFSLMALTLILFPFLTDLVLIMLTAILFGFGFGIITPNLYDVLAELSPSELRTSVLAIGTGFNSMGQFVSPIILEPILKQAGLSVVFFAAAGLSMLAGLLSLGQRNRD